ncbi:MAG: flagellar biosynthetic protein FliO [Phycisphaerae bacterium]|nr:flagellar biosynthetic protein FliO [Phycisphaerae bacterium]
MPTAYATTEPAEIPSVATPSSGIMIDTTTVREVPPAPKQSTGDKQTTQPASGTGLQQIRSTVLKRSTPTPTAGASATRKRPWYRNSLLVLTSVLGLILLVSYVARRYVPAVRALGGGALRVMQRTPLSSKQSLALIQVGRRMVLIGITPDQISTLSVIDDPEECAHLRVSTNTGAKTADSNFDKVLSAEADKFDRQPLETAIAPTDGSQRLQDAKGHLEGMLRKLKKMQVE